MDIEEFLSSAFAYAETSQRTYRDVISRSSKRRIENACFPSKTRGFDSRHPLISIQL